MHSLSNSLFGSQEPYWRSGVGSPYSSLQPLSGMAPNLGNSYSPYDQYSTHPAVASRYIIVNITVNILIFNEAIGQQYRKSLSKYF
jgi:hypothetical protein